MASRFLLAVLALAGVLAASRGATAQEPDALAAALVPSRLELSLQPGGSETQDVKIINKGERPFRVVVRSVAVDLGELENTYVLDPRKVAVSAAEWVRVTPAEFDVPATEERSVVVDVAAPTAASLGSYQAMVLFDLYPGQLAGDDSVALQARMGGFVLVDVTNPGAELLRQGEAVHGVLEVRSRHLFDGWRPDPGALIDRPRVRAGVDLKNTGNAYLVALGSFRFHGTDGSSASEEIGPVVVPQGTGHIYQTDWRRSFYLGSVSVDTELVYAVGGDGLITLPERYDTWVVPWAQIEGLLVVIAVAGVVLWVRRRRLRAQSMRAAGPFEPAMKERARS